MKEYLQNLIPRIKKHSQALDRKELFSDQPWVIVDEALNKQQIIFKRDGRLLMSHNGQGFEGRWEYLPEVNGIWIDRGFDKLLLNQGFFLDGVMILKKDGFKDDPVFFANPNKVPDLDIPKYLEPIIKQKEESARIEHHILTFHLETGEDLDIFDCVSLSYIADNICRINDKVPTDGTYKMLNDCTHFVIREGRLGSVYYRKEYVTDLGDLFLHQKLNEYIRYGDVGFQNENLHPTGRFNFVDHNDIEWLRINKGEITKIKYKGQLPEFVPLLLILILIIGFILLFVKLFN